MGAVFSQMEGFTTLGGLWPAFAFHAICTGLGTYLVGRAAAVRRAGAQQRQATATQVPTA